MPPSPPPSGGPSDGAGPARGPGARPRLEVARYLPPGDVARVLELVAAATAADGVGPLSEHVLLHLRQGGEEPGRHLLLVEHDPDAAAPRSPAEGDPGQRVVGYAHLDPTDRVAGPSAELVVAPDRRRRGLGSVLVRALEREIPARIRLWAHGAGPGARAMARSLGYEVVRELWQMRRSFTEPLPPATIPAGVSVTTYTPADETALLGLNAAAFADHPEQGGWTRRDLRARMAEDWFDPAGLFLARSADSGDLLGFHWTKIHGDAHVAPAFRSGGAGPAGPDTPPRHGHEPIGEVYVVGVDPRAQGMGLGRALTLVGLHHLRDADLPQAMLYVDADNAPAVAVYSRLGFRHWHSDVQFTLPSRRAEGP